jgi:hypothetical protein
MTKSILTFYFICLNTFLYSQNINITGRVLDVESKKPIPDVLIIVNHNIIAYSDINGKYILELPKSFKNEIVFSHISYETKSYNLNNLVNHSEISLKNTNNYLDEIVISSTKISKKEILKIATKNYKNKIRKESYWSSVNLKQVLKYKDSVPCYLEVDGNLFSLGDDRNVWNWPILVPEESRRTKENFIKSKAEKKLLKERNQLYSNFGLESFNSAFLLHYGFFENGHPLSKNGRNLYRFSIENTIELDNEKCYVINYEAKKPITKIKSWPFYKIRGQIIVTKENLTLKKITSLFRRFKKNKEDGIDVIFTINYQLINDIIYPKNISYDIKFPQFESKGILNFKNIYEAKIENYRKKISSNRYLFRFSEVYNKYNSLYWKSKPLRSEFLINELNSIFNKKNTDSIFLEGAKQKIFVKKNELNLEQPEKKILSLMYRDMN